MENEKPIVLIPMAGAGSRFAQAGYTFPKPLIMVHNKPMIQVVIDNLKIDGDYIFLVQKEHYEKYKLEHLLNLLKPGCSIVEVDGLTEGAACTTLLAKYLINNKRPLVIANSDQFIEYDSEALNYFLNNPSDLSYIDGLILSFESTHPKWSFAEVVDGGFVSKVAEKDPISKNATVGIYVWSMGCDYVRYAEQMIKKNLRVNNEFYICPVYNEAIESNSDYRIMLLPIEKMWGLGTPEDLDYFLNHYKGEI